MKGVILKGAHKKKKRRLPLFPFPASSALPLLTPVAGMWLTSAKGGALKVKEPLQKVKVNATLCAFITF